MFDNVDLSFIQNRCIIWRSACYGNYTIVMTIYQCERIKEPLNDGQLYTIKYLE